MDLSPLGSRDRRIVLLGKTGAGKSSTGNTIFGGNEEVFKAEMSPSSLTETCTSRSRIIDGRKITLTDTPGIFDTRMSEVELKKVIFNCMTEYAGGVHAFLIVLLVETFTVQEKEICTKIQQSFSDEVLKYATVLFTHGYQLKGQTVQEFVKENYELSELVQKCGGRCHVIDNEHWNQGQQDKNSINQVQVSELLKTIDQMVEQNGGGCYTNEMLQAVEEDIQAERMLVREESGGKLSEEEIICLAKERVQTKLHVKLAGLTVGVLVGALFGIATVVVVALSLLVKPFVTGFNVGSAAAAVTAAAEAGVGVGVGAGLGIAAGVVVGTAAIAGGIGGGIVGYKAAEGKETAGEAAEAAARALFDKAKPVLNRLKVQYSKLKDA